MTLPDILRLVISVLEDASVPYMLTGSLAAAFYATPRATQDIDLVLEASGDQLGKIADRLRREGFT